MRARTRSSSPPSRCWQVVVHPPAHTPQTNLMQFWLYGWARMGANPARAGALRGRHTNRRDQQFRSCALSLPSNTHLGRGRGRGSERELWESALECRSRGCAAQEEKIERRRRVAAGKKKKKKKTVEGRGEVEGWERVTSATALVASRFLSPPSRHPDNAVPPSCPRSQATTHAQAHHRPAGRQGRARGGRGPRTKQRRQPVAATPRPHSASHPHHLLTVRRDDSRPAGHQHDGRRLGGRRGLARRLLLRLVRPV